MPRTPLLLPLALGVPRALPVEPPPAPLLMLALAVAEASAEPVVEGVALPEVLALGVCSREAEGRGDGVGEGLPLPLGVLLGQGLPEAVRLGLGLELGVRGEVLEAEALRVVPPERVAKMLLLLNPLAVPQEERVGVREGDVLVERHSVELPEAVAEAERDIMAEGEKVEYQLLPVGCGEAEGVPPPPVTVGNCEVPKVAVLKTVALVRDVVEAAALPVALLVLHTLAVAVRHKLPAAVALGLPERESVPLGHCVLLGQGLPEAVRLEKGLGL